MSKKRETTFSIYVRFRRSRLTLMRGIRDLAEAVAYAEQLRKTRLHDRENVIVVREPGGEIIDEAALTQPAAAGSTNGHAGAPEAVPAPPDSAAPEEKAPDAALEEAPLSPLSKRLNDALDQAQPALAMVLHLRDALQAFEQLGRTRAQFHGCLEQLIANLPEHPDLAERIRRLAAVGRELTTQTAVGEQKFATMLVLLESWLAHEGPGALAGAAPASARHDGDPPPGAIDVPPDEGRGT